MMRFAAALVLLMVACTDGDAPPELVSDFGVSTDSGAPADLIGGSTPVDLIGGGTPVDGGNASCVARACGAPGLVGNVQCRMFCQTTTATCVPADGGNYHCIP